MPARAVAAQRTFKLQSARLEARISQDLHMTVSSEQN